jgi:nucleoside-diphosphate-sugar epimerase
MVEKVLFRKNYFLFPTRPAAACSLAEKPLADLADPWSAAPMSLNLLVLGGTSWLGGALARLALDRGHRVTCLARGESGSVPDGAEWVRANRTDRNAYEAVSQQAWDAVLDVSRQPVHVRTALEALAARSQHWIYVSTCSVYADDSTPDTDESAPLHEPWTGAGLASAEEYGPAKAACEVACRETVPEDQLLVARAGLIVGYGDHSDRFGYWPGRLARATESPRVLAPPQDSRLQVIDVVDLATWLVTAAESRTHGVLNAIGDELSLGDVLAECTRAAAVEATLVEVDQPWLVQHEVAPWGGAGSMPLWLPLPEYAGFMSRRNDAAKRSGLRFRPLADTVRDALVWERELGLSRERKAGLSSRREAELLDAVLSS